MPCTSWTVSRACVEPKLCSTGQTIFATRPAPRKTLINGSFLTKEFAFQQVFHTFCTNGTRRFSVLSTALYTGSLVKKSSIVHAGPSPDKRAKRPSALTRRPLLNPNPDYQSMEGLCPILSTGARLLP